MNVTAPAPAPAAPLAHGGRGARPWLVLAGCIVGLSVSVGPLFLSSFAVFIQPMSAALGWTRGQLSMLFALANLAVVLASPVIGGMVRRFGTVRVVRVASVLLALTLLAAMAAPPSLIVYALIFFVAGAVGSGTHTFVYLSLIPRWFPQRLGLMLGIAMTGIGIGQAVAPLAALSLIERFGWRTAYGTLGIVALLVTVTVSLLLIRDQSPSAVTNTVADAPEVGRETGISASAALRSAPFWLLAASFLLISGVASGCAVHFVAILGDRGIAPGVAAALIASSGIALGISRLAGGYLLDRIGPFVVGPAVFLGGVLATGILLLPTPPGLLFVVPLLLGVILGIEGDIMPYLARRLYGVVDYERIYSRFFSFYSAGILVGPLMMGLTYDRFHSYRPALAVLFVAAGAAVLAILAARTARIVAEPSSTGQPPLAETI